MQEAPLMPKATAVWLVENTALSFDQVADFCKLHPLEVKAIADGDAAQGIKGLDPIQTGQLTREEIDKGVAEPDHKLQLSRPKVDLPPAKPTGKKKGPRYTPVSRRQDRPNAILWLIRNHPELKDAQIMRLVGTTKSTIAGIRDRTHWNAASSLAARSGHARPVLADRPRLRGAARLQGKAGAGRQRRDAAAGRGHHRAAGARRAGKPRPRPRPRTTSTPRPCSPSSSSSAARPKTRTRSSVTRRSFETRSCAPQEAGPSLRQRRASRRMAAIRRLRPPAHPEHRPAGHRIDVVAGHLEAVLFVERDGAAVVLVDQEFDAAPARCACAASSSSVPTLLPQNSGATTIWSR